LIAAMSIFNARRSESANELPYHLTVGVDARTVYASTRRGTGKNLIDLYRTLAEQQPGWTFVLFHQRDADDPFHGMVNVAARRIDMAGDRWNLWQDARLPLAAWTGGIDVLHCPANLAPRWTKTPTVVTIHDLIPFELAPNAPETDAWMRRVAHGAHRAREVLTPSAYTRDRLMATLGLPAERITVNYWAPDRHTQRVTDRAVLRAVRRKYAVSDDVEYVLAFGAEDPRKNTVAILHAWSRLPGAIRQQCHLLIVGLQPAALGRMQESIKALITDGSCHLHGFADEADMSALISGALALCYPSRLEGFGLPILDAFTCGTPVLTSTRTSLPEVTGDAGIQVDPDDIGAITAGLAELVTSAERRDALRAAGLRRVQLFSWERCARTAAEVLARAARPAD
jgi:glycosyltransferase involved in cell wall biosynthesis